ncbi:thiamine phosphate synthase [Helicobacter macacae]|uniref:Thiamine phosphate synthase/TenI domain-containing protein n=1 Tax=Helicobacter macacae MIT 99-5501 TaxID=1357400 RepID=V8C9R8_9HELI|nr:thiamine phosphate synthase [Helicobacter macacae]ETD24158.1 hypothetical protein HMPREF2086_00906 [Helicobacter macacae MIT 99-5501]
MCFQIIAITDRKLCKSQSTNTKNTAKDIDKFLARLELLAKSGVDSVILREKDLRESEYLALAKEAIRIFESANKANKTNSADTNKANANNSSNECKLILHNFIEVAYKLEYPFFHAPFCVLEDLVSNKISTQKISENGVLGVSIHSLEELAVALDFGVDYVIAGNVFESACKEGVQGRGVEFLREILARLGQHKNDLTKDFAKNLPIYAVGGICKENLAMLCKDIKNALPNSRTQASNNAKTSVQEVKTMEAKKIARAKIAGVCMRSALMECENPKAYIAQCKEIITKEIYKDF